MPAPPPDARSLRSRVLEVTPCGSDAVILALESDSDLGPLRASRFFMLRRERAGFPLIPRPYSIYKQDGRRLEFLIQTIGRGSRALAEAAPGDEIGLVGPLGNGWPTLDGDGAPWVMLAGGVGSAPFYMAIEQALAGASGGWAGSSSGGAGAATPCRPDQVHFLFGASGQDRLYDWPAFTELPAHTEAATLDGSLGFQGNVLELLEQRWESGAIPREVRLLACGPEPMLEAVERLARERGLPAWLSLETYMGCGVGICNGCPVPTCEDGPMGDWPNAKACVEGPVFPVEAVTLLQGH